MQGVQLGGVEVAGPAVNVREEIENAKSAPCPQQTGGHPRPVYTPKTSDKTSNTYSVSAFASLEKKKFPNI